MNKEPNIWGNCTDPARHNPNEYRYLVHGFNPSASNVLGVLSLQNAINQDKQGIKNLIQKMEINQLILLKILKS